MHSINNNAVQGCLCENYLTRIIITRNIKINFRTQNIHDLFY